MKIIVPLIYVVILISFICSPLITLRNSHAANNTAQAPDLVYKSQVNDPYNFLGVKSDEINNLVTKIHDKKNITIWIIYDNNLEFPTQDLNNDLKIDMNDWMEEVSIKNNFTENDIVLAVSTSSHELSIYTKNTKYFNSSKLNIISNEVIKQLNQENWGEAALTFCNFVDKFSDNTIYYFAYITMFLFFAVSICGVLLILKRRTNFRLTHLSNMQNRRRATHKNAISNILHQHRFNNSFEMKSENENNTQIPNLETAGDGDDLFVKSEQDKNKYFNYYNRAATQDLYGSYYHDENAQDPPEKAPQNQRIHGGVDYTSYLPDVDKELKKEDIEKYYE